MLRPFEEGQDSLAEVSNLRGGIMGAGREEVLRFANLAVSDVLRASM